MLGENQYQMVNPFHRGFLDDISKPVYRFPKDIAELKDIIFGEQGLGNCIVYFHLDNIKGKNYIVKANGQLNVSHSDEFIAGLKEAENVVDVWTA